jgi:hypothetical protein
LGVRSRKGWDAKASGALLIEYGPKNDRHAVWKRTDGPGARQYAEALRPAAEDAATNAGPRSIR